jgi:2-phosphoglycerate kinase
MSERRHSEPLPLGGEQGPPYSKGLMARALMATGVGAVAAYELARRIELDLDSSGVQATTLERIEELACELLGREAGGSAIQRLRRYSDFQELDLPIILLVGGATGTGKSTVATESAYRLGITRVTSTDFVRQTMRAFFSKEFMPSIHYSSFEVGGRDADEPNPLLNGFLDQTRNVLVGVRAAIDRAMQEGWSMVLEGVHLVPGMFPASIEGALVVQCVLAIEDQQEHASHFSTRGDADGARAPAKYLQHLGDIRTIQTHIVERARKHGVPVIENEGMQQAVTAVIELVLERAAEEQRVDTGR